MITVAMRAADDGNGATAICRAAGGENRANGTWRLGWRRPGRRPAALLSALRTASGLGPRATRTVSASVHRPPCHRRHLSHFLAFVRNFFDVPWLPGCSVGGTVSAAPMALDARALGLWFSVFEVGSDGRR